MLFQVCKRETAYRLLCSKLQMRTGCVGRPRCELRTSGPRVWRSNHYTNAPRESIYLSNHNLYILLSCLLQFQDARLSSVLQAIARTIARLNCMQLTESAYFQLITV